MAPRRGPSPQCSRESATPLLLAETKVFQTTQPPLSFQRIPSHGCRHAQPKTDAAASRADALNDCPFRNRGSPRPHPVLVTRLQTFVLRRHDAVPRSEQRDVQQGRGYQLLKERVRHRLPNFPTAFREVGCKLEKPRFIDQLGICSSGADGLKESKRPTMRIVSACIAFGWLLSVPRDASAQQTTFYFVTGETLYAQCLNSKDLLASAYIAGVSDAHDGLRTGSTRPPKFCTSPSTSIDQAVDVVCKYLAEHPERRHFTGASLIFSALRESFPCSR
jgi:hypothetical protein